MAQASTTSEQTGERLTDQLPDDTLIGWLGDMQLIREFETRTMQAYQQAKIGGFCHVYNGQEASAVGCIACVEHDDPVICAYRDHGHALARGMDPFYCMAEMFGKLDGCAKGKGGSMHMFDRPNNLYGGHGIVGAHTPLGAGLAFATRYEWEVLGTGSKRVTLCFLGDGALDQGAFYEAMNLASLYSLPVVYIVENNGYSMGTAIGRHAANHENITSRAEAFGITAKQIDGFDILNIYNELKPMADDCREMQRPAFVDLITYRYQGHSMSDPRKYRTAEEEEQWKEKDSIASLAHHLISQRDALTEERWTEMQREIRDRVKRAVDQAEQAEAPDPERELYSDVYSNPAPNLSPIRAYSQGAKNSLL